MSDSKSVTAEYIMGIKEGRSMLEKHGPEIANDELDNLRRTIKCFQSSTPVGQMLRGERDFWLNQIKRQA